MKELKLRIAGIGMSLKWEGSRIIDWPHPRYEDFISNGKVDVNLRVHCGHFPEFTFDEMLFDGKEEGNWRLFRSNSGFVIETFDTLTRKKNKVCLLGPDFQSGDVYIDVQQERARQRREKGLFFSFPFLIQPLAEILLVNLLPKDQGIVVHGSGISDRGKGIAFLGRSGAGKSTLARLYKKEKGVVILSDERIVIRKEKDGFWLYGTPWPGMAMAASSERVPLKSIFFIEHAQENTLLGQATLSDLFPMLFLPFWDKERLHFVLEFCGDLIETLECRKVGFRKDKSVIEFVDSVS